VRHNPALAQTVDEFLGTSDSDTLLSIRGAFDTAVTPEQDRAWEDEVATLRAALEGLPSAVGPWGILWEWMPPLLTTRLDVLLLTGAGVIPLEFKQAGRAAFNATNKRQVLGYAADLYWFYRPRGVLRNRQIAL
jgi:hypothetical protein